MQPTVWSALAHRPREPGLTTLESTTTTTTCLGCGCACDDLEVVVANGQASMASPACPLASAWTGGTWPAAVRASGAPVTAEAAVAAAATLLQAARARTLVIVAPGLVLDAQREAIALADGLHATIDSATSTAAAEGILAAQRRGRPGATLGELRNRADLVVFWGIDPSARYPRFNARYALDPVGTQVTTGRAGRTAVGVSIGVDHAAPADLSLTFTADQEVTALSLLRALVHGTPAPTVPPAFAALTDLAARMVAARYVAIVHEAEPGAEPARAGTRAEALITLVQALNTPTRAVLVSLRAGGNRNGFESVLTWQTGYPMAVDFGTGVPTYAPAARGLSLLGAGRFDVVLVAGDASGLDTATREALSGVPTIAIGPRASEHLPSARIQIDTGSAGIHEAGIAYRMDDVALPVHAVLNHPVSATETLRALRLGALAGASPA
jgi:formylmethanofuran dehydrogenase subunit B